MPDKKKRSKKELVRALTKYDKLAWEEYSLKELHEEALARGIYEEEEFYFIRRRDEHETSNSA